ncbi:MAG: aldose 1-epimerase family protein [Planctomycetaceae bacterium]|jgi:galactose mutarotase-like enzyme|nr:aldose 1-epimerase family protein [Planctomycetaceae bacterium]
MTLQHWTLLDTKHGIYQETFDFSCGDVNISKRRLHGGRSDGVDIVRIDNGKLAVFLLPTRGMGLWKVLCGDVELKWDSPASGPVHPALVPVSDPGGLGWLEGFDEWLVRCGLESNGSPEFNADGSLRYPLHGRIANLPAHSLALSFEPETGKIMLTGKVLESKLFFKKLELTSTLAVTAGSTEWTVQDTITNLSSEPGEFELLYHINTGQPFAAPGSKVAVPFDLMTPRTRAAAENLPHWDTLCPEMPGSEEVVFFFEPAGNADGECQTMLTNPKGSRGLGLSFSVKEFPYFCFWKSRLANTDGYVCGMEPCVNFPNTKSFEKKHDRVVPLKPGESKTFGLRFDILTDTPSVQKREKEISGIAGLRKIEPQPKKEWSE